MSDSPPRKPKAVGDATDKEDPWGVEIRKLWPSEKRSAPAVEKSMRLNFSGSSEDDIREGIRRIGELVREQVELYGTLTGRPAAGPSTPAEPAPRTDLADVLALPRRERETRRRDAT